MEWYEFQTSWWFTSIPRKASIILKVFKLELTAKNQHFSLKKNEKFETL